MHQSFCAVHEVDQERLLMEDRDYSVATTRATEGKCCRQPDNDYRLKSEHVLSYL